MSFAIQRLNEGERATLLAHFLALSTRDRGLRFGTVLAPPAIEAYIGRMDFSHDAIFGVRDRTLELVGVAHLAFEADTAELGLSVLPTHRDRGLGTALFKRALAHARKRSVPKFIVHFLSVNAPIMRIAQKFGMHVVAGFGDAVASLRLRPICTSTETAAASDPPVSPSSEPST